MIQVRHRSAAGGSEQCWYFDAYRKFVSVQLSTACIAIDVCTSSKPRYGAFPITRVDSNTWRIVPVRFTKRAANGQLLAEPSSPANVVGFQTITLLNTPESVCEEFVGLNYE